MRATQSAVTAGTVLHQSWQPIRGGILSTTGSLRNLCLHFCSQPCCFHSAFSPQRLQHRKTGASKQKTGEHPFDTLSANMHGVTGEKMQRTQNANTTVGACLCVRRRWRRGHLQSWDNIWTLWLQCSNKQQKRLSSQLKSNQSFRKN